MKTGNSEDEIKNEGKIGNKLREEKGERTDVATENSHIHFAHKKIFL